MAGWSCVSAKIRLFAKEFSSFFTEMVRVWAVLGIGGSLRSVVLCPVELESFIGPKLFMKVVDVQFYSQIVNFLSYHLLA